MSQATTRANDASERHDLAYVFGRFPTYDKTFCAREVQGLRRMKVRPLVFSIRDVGQEPVRHYPDSLYEETVYLPERKSLRRRAQWFTNWRLPSTVRRVLRDRKVVRDAARMYEGAWIGAEMARRGVSHLHAHFMGMAARTAWWVHRMYGYSFSISAHANDLFCGSDPDVPHERLLESASALLVESDFARRWAQERYPTVRSKAFTVHNGLDVDDVAARSDSVRRQLADSARAEAPLIASVGRLVEKKGHSVLLEACAMLRDRQVRFHCQLVGDGPLRSQLQERLAALRLEGHVELLGPRSQQQIVDTLARARLFALACVEERDGGQDNLPTAIMEAMAAGLPCVSTRVAGVPELVVHDVTGHVVEPHDPGSLAAALERLLADPDLSRAMGAAGRARARERFDQATTSRALWSVLEPLCRE
jgi:glycosyltransferase involved in cell wall biosynthesis